MTSRHYQSSYTTRVRHHNTMHNRTHYLSFRQTLLVSFLILMASIKAESPPSGDTTPVAYKVTSGESTSLTKSVKHNRWGPTKPVTTSLFKGGIPELSSKVFVVGPAQATKYDEAYRALTHYFGKKFNHRVFRAFEAKDSKVGLELLIKPTPPKVEKIVQEPTAGDASVMKGVKKEVIDTDSEDYLEYSLELKNYVSEKAKYNDNLQQCFSMIISQCSPAVEQNLEAEDTYANIKAQSDSIELIKLLEKLCYNYRAHEFKPLGAWDAMDKLSSLQQPDHVHEVKHYETFRSVIEMCRASGVNFAVMCSANINMAMKTLKDDGKITADGTYEDGTYFSMDGDERKLVNKAAEEICLSTRFLSLASNKLHSGSKQELRNDMVKGEDKYPRTIAATLRFLQYHDLRGKGTSDKKKTKLRSETAFAQEEEDNDSDSDKPPPQPKSKTCGKWRAGNCPYKKKHTWKECPTNKYGPNFGKETNADGNLILCTVEEFCEETTNETDPALIERVYEEEGDEIVDNNKNTKSAVKFYCPHHSDDKSSYCSDNIERIFMQSELASRVNRLLAQGKSKVNEMWVLLDNQSTVDLFYNAVLLDNIEEVNDYITVHCNAGTVKVNMMGNLPGYGKVWYYPHGIANILSLFKVAQRFHIQYDNVKSSSFFVWKDDGSYREFKPGPKGLHYSDYSPEKEMILVNEHEVGTAIDTVRKNLTRFTQRQVEDARCARKLQHTTGLSTSALLRMIDSGALANSPVTREAVRNSIIIWGESVASKKGRTTRSSPNATQIDIYTITSIPPHIINEHGMVVLCIDIMKVNKVPFFVTTSRVIKFGSATELKNMEISIIIPILVTILHIYVSRGFTVISIAADNGFAALENNKDFLSLGVNLNLTSEDEHEPHVERFIRTLKERCRMCFALLPFTRIPKRMVIELVYCQIYWHNFTIPADYISDRLGPAAIVLGRTYDYNSLCGPGTLFGEYVQTHESTDNTMRERTVGAITLRPSGNVQGSYYYYSLTTGRRLHRRKCTPIPMPQEVVDRVHSIAQRQRTQDGILFTRADGSLFEDPIDVDVTANENNEDDESLQNNEDQGVHEDSSQSDDEQGVTENDSFVEGVNDDNSEIEFEIENEQNHVDHDVVQEDNVSLQSESVDSTHSNIQNDVIIPQAEEVPAPQQIQPENVQPAVQQNRRVNLDVNIDNIIPENERRRRKAPDRDPNEGYQLLTYVESQQAYADSGNTMQYGVEHLMFTQLFMTAGIKAYGQQGVDAIVKEMKQFHDREVVRPLLPEQITPDIKKRALGYLMFLKMKRTGEVKGRGCADGRPQRIYKDKLETSSPTVCTESVFIGSAMDAKEKRAVAHVDIPGAFLQTEASDDTIIKIQGVLVTTLVKINPEWKKYVVLEGKRQTPTIYSKAIKALYGTVDAAKLFYDNLSSFLINDMGFKRNTYDSCVLNKDIKGSQCTIMFHVDDLKLSHASEDVLTTIIEALNKRYGGIMPLSISRGRIHDYLGMVFNYNTEGQVTIHMYQYVNEVLNGVPDRYKEGIGSATPASSNLYDIRNREEEDVTLLSNKEREEFHTVTAQLLYLSKRARPDLQTAIAFLCTRVKSPDADDDKKLARVIRYLEKTKYLPLILRVNKNGAVQWWVDASFAVHEDMRSRTGINMSLGVGTVYGASQKQKINTSSSTEAELVGVADAMPKMIWCKYFMQEQGYIVSDVYVYQDNESAILLETNGMRSVGKGSRHINIKYFFVTDKVKGKELKVMHCPTGEMIADFYTKPLQGSAFIKHRNSILGINDGDIPLYQKQYAQYIASLKE